MRKSRKITYKGRERQEVKNKKHPPWVIEDVPRGTVPNEERSRK